SGRPMLSIHRNGADHHGRPYFDLIAIKSDKGLLVGRHVEVARKNPVSRSWGELRICAPGHFSAVLPESQNQCIERFTCLSRHLDPRKALVGPLLADFNLSDLKVRAVGQNLIEYLW